MNDSKISVRYARALFESTVEQGLLEKTRDDMLLIQEISALDEFQYMLVSPVIKESEKISLMEKVLGKMVQPLTISLINLVIRNGREQFIPGIARNFIALYKKHKGISSAVFTTAASVSEEVKKKIESIIRSAFKTDVDLVANVDEELIGGFVLRIEDQQYDASVVTSLKKVKKQILK